MSRSLSAKIMQKSRSGHFKDERHQSISKTLNRSKLEIPSAKKKKQQTQEECILLSVVFKNKSINTVPMDELMN